MEVNGQNEAVAAKALESSYDVPATEGLERQIHSVATQLTQVYWLDHQQDILGIVDGSYLEGYDEFNVEAAFHKAASLCLQYALLSRCGLNPETRFEHEDFLPIFDWNTPEAVAILGTAVSDMSEEVLRHLEINLRNYERSHEYERADISPRQLIIAKKISDFWMTEERFDFGNVMLKSPDKRTRFLFDVLLSARGDPQMNIQF